ncbi:MAG: DcrB-related protein [Planctomycetota bacterium]
MNKPTQRILLFVCGVAAFVVGVIAFRDGLRDLTGSSIPGVDEAAAEARSAIASLEAVPLQGHGLTLRCPRNWTKETPTEGPLVLRINTLKGVVNANVAVEDVAEGTTAQAYADLNLKALRDSFERNQISLTTETPTPTTIGGRPGVMLRCSYRLKDPDVPLQITQVYTVANRRGYAITFTAPAEIAAQFGALIQEMVASAQFG